MGWIVGANYLAGNFQTAPMIFIHIFRTSSLNDFIKGPQTKYACAFLPLNISAVGSVFFYAPFNFNTFTRLSNLWHEN